MKTNYFNKLPEGYTEEPWEDLTIIKGETTFIMDSEANLIAEGFEVSSVLEDSLIAVCGTHTIKVRRGGRFELLIAGYSFESNKETIVGNEVIVVSKIDLVRGSVTTLSGLQEDEHTLMDFESRILKIETQSQVS